MTLHPPAYQRRGRCRLPFRGSWLAVNGGVTEETSHSWDIKSQRYAYDFVIAGEEEKSWRGSGAQ